ncbi:MAG: SPOR domain-containing protein [Candidatus Omnitrophica bacterium]|nr:SPOR domain-containing protein [Candidatus Omnitrophota bacterium]
MERVEAVGQAVLSRPEENPVKAVQVIQRDKQQSARETSEAAVSAAAVPEGPYVIQLASYVGVHSAQAEADRLRRQGFNPRVIKQGKYYELRVVGYRSKMEAMDKLATLRKTYHDGFVKRLSSS